MKKILFAFILLPLSMSFSQELKINAEKAVVAFNFVSEKTEGTIKGLEAVIQFNIADLSASSISGSVSVSKISTGNGTRDKHLQSDEFFDAAKYPKISFKSSSIAKDGDQYKMKGIMTMRGIEKEVEFTFTYSDKVFKGRSTVYSEDWGVMKKKKREESKVEITIEIPVL